MLRAVAQQQCLSYYCKSSKVIKNNKLNLFGKGIAIIDNAALEPHVLSSLLELDLSHNSIRSIQSIQQFANIQILNLSHNMIGQLSQIEHLASLKRLRKLAIKKNPFLKDKLPLTRLQFLLSLETDVDLISEDVDRKINEIVKLTAQLWCYKDYHRKVFLHVKLLKESKVDGSFVNPNISMFPKIKKILQQFYEPNMHLRRHLLSSIDREHFQDEKRVFVWLQRAVDRLKQDKGQLIKQIYDVEQTLKQLRISFNSRAQIKLQERTNLKALSQADLSRKPSNSKLNSAIANLRGNRARYENSPSKLNLDLRDVGNCQKYLQQNFVGMLVKTNALFHLLHSPLQSLKNHEKQMLIQQLLALLKDKMREIIRYQAAQKDNATIKSDFESLQQHLEYITGQVKKEQEATALTMQRLRQQCDDQEFKLESLSSELEKTTQLNKELAEENVTLKGKLRDKQFKAMQEDSEERNAESIIVSGQSGLKLKYLRCLTKKASHLAKLRVLKQVNRKVRQNELKQLVFEDLKVSHHIGKRERYLGGYLSRKNKKAFMQQLQQNSAEHHLDEYCRRLTSTKKLRSFFSRLQDYFSDAYRINTKIKMFTSKMDKRLKSKYFQVLQTYKAEREEQSLYEQIDECRNQLVTQRHFRLWRKYCRFQAERYARGRQQIVGTKKARSLSILMEKCQVEMNFFIHSQALQNFLLKYRKINCYLNFTRSLGSTLLQRSIKAMKVQKMKLYTYFQYFLTTTRDMKLKRKIKHQETKLKREKEVKQAEHMRAMIQHKKRGLISVLRRAINKISFSLRCKIVNRQKISLQLYHQRMYKFSRLFYAQLRSSWTNQVKISHKKMLLKNSPALLNRINEFFKLLSYKKIMKFKAAAQFRRTISVSFYRWKSYLFYCRMQSYKEKFQQFQSQLAAIAGLQGELKEQKKLLSGKLAQKQIMISEFLKKLEEYEYILQSKDAKYEKLKQIYAEAVQVTDLNNTLKNCQSKFGLHDRKMECEENFYMKYLPSDVQMKIGTTHRNDRNTAQLPTKIEAFQSFQPESLSNNDQSYRRGEREAGETTFVSTFRRF